VKKILAFIGALSLVGLTACGSVNSAATLGDITITQEQLQTSVDQLLTERATVDTSQMQLESGATLNRSQLRFQVITTIFEEIAKELKINLTDSEIAASKATLITQSGGETALPTNLVAAQIASTNFDKYIRASLINNKINEALLATGVAEADLSVRISELVSAKANQLKISINPRYGTWDAEVGDIVEIDSAGDAVTTGNSN
jgi:multidrug efflux pump subunit AcrA (membrane-fusion protein)